MSASESSSDSEDIIHQIAMMVADEALPGFEVSETSQQQNVQAKERNKERDFQGAEEKFRRQYLDSDAVYNDADFERRFRMPRSVFIRLLNALWGKGIFRLRKDALKKYGISPLVRIIAALRILAYGKSFDEVDELCEMSASSARESFHGFIEEVIICFGDEYLRPPNEVDLKRILGINATRGFPGCVGSWDCQHWTWKNCPVAWAGQFKGKEKKPTIVLEAVADAELWIWACHFGKPGSLNDVNVLDSSPIVTGILQGALLPDFEYVVNNRSRKHLYFLVDGIYPRWSIFISTIQDSTTQKERLFAKGQEALRKDVERAFGVLISRWALLAKPCLLWDRAFAGKVMKASIILHNMIVEERRDGYDSQICKLASEAVDRGFFLDENGEEKPFVWQDHNRITATTQNDVSDTRWALHLAKVDERMRDEVLHFALKLDLIEHIWCENGNSA